MISLAEEDLQPLETFRLAWRWTKPQHNVLPSDALSGIQPLSKAKASEIYNHTRVFYPDEGFVPGSYDLVSTMETAYSNSEVIRRWLQTSIPDNDERIILSWDNEVAVVTSREIFCRYWDDFCYPASDDVAVFPQSETWMLFYRHEEALFLGKQARGLR